MVESECADVASSTRSSFKRWPDTPSVIQTALMDAGVTAIVGDSLRCDGSVAGERPVRPQWRDAVPPLPIGAMVEAIHAVTVDVSLEASLRIADSPR